MPGGEGFDRSSPRRDDVSRVSQASGERISRALRSKDEPASLHSSPTAANFPPRPPRARSMSATRANSRCPTWRYIPGRFIVGTTGSAPSAAVLAASIAFARPATPIPPHHTRPAGHHPIGQCRDAAGRDGEHLSLSLSILFFSFHRARPYSTSTVPPRRPRDILSPAVHPPSNAERHDEHGLNL